MILIKIGKAESNDIFEDFKNDLTVSREHCQIFIDDQGNTFLTDLNSTNGTFLNGNKILDSVKLNPLDLVKAGNSLVNWRAYVIKKEQKIEPLNIEFDNSKYHKPIKKNNYNWLIIIPVVLISIFFINQFSKESTPETNKNKNTRVKTPVAKEIKKKKPIKKYYAQPKNGDSPYDKLFGKGIYNKGDQNGFLIKNSNSTDVVLLLIDAFSKKKIRNEYIRKGTNFRMDNVPRGTYYLQWVSGINWDPNLKTGNLIGGFENKQSFTIINKEKDWMKVESFDSWTLTLYSVPGGDVSLEKITVNEFLN